MLRIQIQLKIYQKNHPKRLAICRSIESNGLLVQLSWGFNRRIRNHPEIPNLTIFAMALRYLFFVNLIRNDFTITNFFI